jgi:hypothetical protein
LDSGLAPGRFSSQSPAASNVAPRNTGHDVRREAAKFRVPCCDSETKAQRRTQPTAAKSVQLRQIALSYAALALSPSLARSGSVRRALTYSPTCASSSAGRCCWRLCAGRDAPAAPSSRIQCRTRRIRVLRPINLTVRCDERRDGARASASSGDRYR